MWLFSRKNKRSDEELLQAYLQSGDKALIGDLFEKHVQTVYGVCLYYLNDKARAEDAVMQIFEKLMEDLRKTAIRNFRGWLSFVVRNHCINELRKDKVRRFVPENYLDFEMKDADADEEQRLSAITEDQMLRHMREALPLLKEKQRVCIELFYLKNQSYQEISTETGLQLNEVKSYIQNGKRNLKLKIEEKLSQSGDAE